MFDFIKNVAQRMLLDFEDSKKASHTGLKGRARERAVVKEFLSQYLPKRYSISSGIIIDVNSQESKQQDIIIYDNFTSPVLKDLEDEKIFFPENVLVSIEVKSTLNKNELKDTFEKAESIYGLSFSPNPSIRITPQIASKAIKPPILTIGFAYKATKSIESLRDDLREIKANSPTKNALSFICVFEDKDGNSGLIVHVDEKNVNKVNALPNENDRLAILSCEDPGTALMYMYLLLMTYLQMNGIFIATPNFSEYAKATGLKENQISIAKEDLSGTQFITEGQNVAVDDAFRMSELTKKLFEDGLNDEEAMDFLLTMTRLPKMQFLLNPNARYFELVDREKKEFREMTEMPRTLRIIQAIQNIKNNSASEEDHNVFDQYKEMTDRIGNKELTVEIRT